MSEGSAPVIALTSDQRRSRRKHAVRPKTISVKRMTKRELEVGRALFPDTNHPRPRTRAECADGPRPCPYVSCKYHLYLDVLPRTGAIKLNFPDLEVEELRESCALDVADREGSTLEEVAAAINTTRSRVRQVELLILTRAKQQAPELQEHLGDVRRLPVLPTAPHEDSMKPNLIPQLLAYCASVDGGAKNTSLFSWLKSQHVSRAQAKELLEQLVREGRLQLVEKPIAGGEVVVRYLPAEAVEPAPLPKSDAPPEEPHPPVPSEETPAPIEEPVMVAGAPEPCQKCAELQQGIERFDRLRQESEVAWGREVHELRQERDLAKGEAFGLRQERDCLADTLGIRTSERDDLAVRLDRTEDHRYYLALLAELDGGAEWSAVRPAIARALQEAAPRPTVDGGAVAQYLLTLPADHWSALATARQQLAQAREMAHAAQLLETSALATVDQILSAPAGAQAPAPAVPEPRVELVRFCSTPRQLAELYPWGERRKLRPRMVRGLVRQLLAAGQLAGDDPAALPDWSWLWDPRTASGPGTPPAFDPATDPRTGEEETPERPEEEGEEEATPEFREKEGGLSICPLR